MSFIIDYMEDLYLSYRRTMTHNTVQLADSSTAKFSMGTVFFQSNREVVGKYTRDKMISDKYIVESNKEFVGTVIIESSRCRIIAANKTMYIAKGNLIKAYDSREVLAWYSGDIVGASAAFLCLNK